jgi:hypothetical protein
MYTIRVLPMDPEFYSLGMLMEQYYARKGSSMKEKELREAIDQQLALEQEGNQ